MSEDSLPRGDEKTMVAVLFAAYSSRSQPSYVPILDSTLSKEFCRIPTRLSCCRSIQAHFPDEPDRMVLVVGDNQWKSYDVSLYDVDTTERILTLDAKHSMDAWGLEMVYLPSSTPRVVSGSRGGHNVHVSDAKTGKDLCCLPDPPCSTFQVLCVRQWSLHEIYVSGQQSPHGRVTKYDLLHGGEASVQMGEYVGHTTSVLGLDADVDHELLLSAACDNRLKLWSMKDFECVETIQLSDDGRSLYYASDENAMLVGSSGGVVEVWDPRNTRERVKMIETGASFVYEIDRIERNRFVLAATDSVVLLDPFKNSDGESVINTNTTKYSGSHQGITVLRDLDAGSIEVGESIDEEERLAFLIDTLRKRADGWIGGDGVKVLFGTGAVVAFAKFWVLSS